MPAALPQWNTDALPHADAHARGPDIRLVVPGGTRGVRAHPGLLGQALDNLLENACKYSEPGTPVVVRLVEGNNEVGIAVEDRGVGIDAEDLSRIGEPFFRSGSARQRGIGGVGLGCAVAARIASAFGGRLDVESTPGQGTCVAIRLPLTFHQADQG